MLAIPCSMGWPSLVSSISMATPVKQTRSPYLNTASAAMRGDGRSSTACTLGYSRAKALTHSSKPPCHVPGSPKPGRPCTAGTSPGAYARVYHSGFLPTDRSIWTSSYFTPASPSSRPSRLQYGQKGVSGPGGAPASRKSSPYDSRAEPAATRGRPGVGGPEGSGISSNSSAMEAVFCAVRSLIFRFVTHSFSFLLRLPLHRFLSGPSVVAKLLKL